MAAMGTGRRAVTRAERPSWRAGGIMTGERELPETGEFRGSVSGGWCCGGGDEADLADLGIADVAGRSPGIHRIAAEGDGTQESPRFEPTLRSIPRDSKLQQFAKHLTIQDDSFCTNIQDDSCKLTQSA